jgi:hypothetical protein
MIFTSLEKVQQIETYRVIEKKKKFNIVLCGFQGAKIFLV